MEWNPKRELFEPVITEEQVLKEIVQRLWLQARIRLWRINCPAGGKVRPNEPGIPDLMGWLRFTTATPCVHTVPLYIEVKRPGGAKRPAQILFIDEAVKAGCAAFFAFSWADVVRNLKRFGIDLKED